MSIEGFVSLIFGLIVIFFNKQFAHAQRDWQRKIGFNPSNYNLNRIIFVIVGMGFIAVSVLLFLGILHVEK